MQYNLDLGQNPKDYEKDSPIAILKCDYQKKQQVLPRIHELKDTTKLINKQFNHGISFV